MSHNIYELVAKSPIDIERRRRHVAAAPGSVEAHATQGRSGTDGGIVAFIRELDVRSRLRVSRIPGLRYCLRPGPRKGQYPIVDWSCAGVLDGVRTAEAAGPLAGPLQLTEQDRAPGVAALA